MHRRDACATKKLMRLGRGFGGGQGPVAQASRLWKPLALPQKFSPPTSSRLFSSEPWVWRPFSLPVSVSGPPVQ